jgi:hypothetical protein
MSDDIGGAEEDSEEDPEFSPDLGFSSVAKPLSYQHPHAHVKTEIGDACFGVPYGDEDDEVDETVLEPAIFAHISSQSRRWHSVDGVLRGVAGEHATVRSSVIISLQFLAGQAQNVAKW